MTAFDEKRHFTRIPFDARVVLTDADDSSYEARLLDISLRGALTSRPDNWHANTGDTCKLRLDLVEGAEDTRLEMEVTVAHQENEQIGFHIEHLGVDTATHLHRLVELNLGDEKLLERELAELAGMTS